MNISTEPTRRLERRQPLARGAFDPRRFSVAAVAAALVTIFAPGQAAETDSALTAAIEGAAARSHRL